MSDEDTLNTPILDLPTTLEELEALYKNAAKAKDPALCLKIYRKVRIMQIEHPDFLTNDQFYLWEERRELIKAALPRDEQWSVYALGG